MAKYFVPRASPIYDFVASMDAAQTYSAFQYLECCLIISRLVADQSNSYDDLDIIFCLPNDEPKYYNHNLNDLLTDISSISKHNPIASTSRKISVQFMPFTYGESLLDRPYNHPVRFSGSKTLTRTDIIGV